MVVRGAKTKRCHTRPQPRLRCRLRKRHEATQQQRPHRKQVEKTTNAPASSEHIAANVPTAVLGVQKAAMLGVVVRGAKLPENVTLLVKVSARLATALVPTLPTQALLSGDQGVLTTTVLRALSSVCSLIDDEESDKLLKALATKQGAESDELASIYATKLVRHSC